MAAHSNKQQIERLEEGLASIRREARADFRLLLGALFTVMFVAMILGFAAVIAAAD